MFARLPAQQESAAAKARAAVRAEEQAALERAANEKKYRMLKDDDDDNSEAQRAAAKRAPPDDAAAAHAAKRAHASVADDDETRRAADIAGLCDDIEKKHLYFPIENPTNRPIADRDAFAARLRDKDKEKTAQVRVGFVRVGALGGRFYYMPLCLGVVDGGVLAFPSCNYNWVSCSRLPAAYVHLCNIWQLANKMSQRQQEEAAQRGAAAASQDRAAVVAQRRLVERQKYLAEREERKLAEAEADLQDEEFLFRGTKLTKDEERRLDAKRRTLELAREHRACAAVCD